MDDAVKVTVGVLAPEFGLAQSNPLWQPNAAPGEADGVVTLQGQRAYGPVVLYFMKGFYSLACRGHVRRLSALKSRLTSYGAGAIILAPGTVHEAAAMAERLQVPYPVLIDENARIAWDYGFRRTLFNTVRQCGTVLVDAEGVVRYVRRTAWPAASLDVDALFLALRHL